MALSNEQVKGYIKRLLLSRMRILANNGFYGLLLMHMKYSLDESCETAYTDGERIAFCPAFMDELTDAELDFVMMHEILHVALRHCKRTGNRDPFLFNIACDIVVNSNILLSNDGNAKTITIRKYGESMHLTPTKEEGHLFTAEEVYEMLLKKSKKNKGGSGNGDDKSDGNGSGRTRKATCSKTDEEAVLLNRRKRVGMTIPAGRTKRTTMAMTMICGWLVLKMRRKPRKSARRQQAVEKRPYSLRECCRNCRQAKLTGVLFCKTSFRKKSTTIHFLRRIDGLGIRLFTVPTSMKRKIG